jgi:dienelactone hydrolase
MSERPGDNQKTKDQRSAGEGVNESRCVQVQAGPVKLEGNLHIPENATGLVVFVHGSGSSRNSPRNQYVASELNTARLATLLFDLLTLEEEEEDLRTRHLRFDIDLLAQRTVAAAGWLSEQPLTSDLKQGFFGASTGAAAALLAAAERPGQTGAIVSRGGRPDLASRALYQVMAPTLLLVGQFDEQVIQLNQQALDQMNLKAEKEMLVIPGATHLFEEPGALEHVARLATDWFGRFLVNDAKIRNKD